MTCGDGKQQSATMRDAQAPKHKEMRSKTVGGGGGGVRHGPAGCQAKIRWTQIAMMLTAMRTTPTTEIGSPRDWPCVRPLTGSGNLC